MSERYLVLLEKRNPDDGPWPQLRTNIYWAFGGDEHPDHRSAVLAAQAEYDDPDKATYSDRYFNPEHGDWAIVCSRWGRALSARSGFASSRRATGLCRSSIPSQSSARSGFSVTVGFPPWR